MQRIVVVLIAKSTTAVPRLSLTPGCSQGPLISLVRGQRQPLHSSLCTYFYAVIVAYAGKVFQRIILRPLLFPYLIPGFSLLLISEPIPVAGPK